MAAKGPACSLLWFNQLLSLASRTRSLRALEADPYDWPWPQSSP